MKQQRRYLFILILITHFSSLFAQNETKASAKPKLVIGIVVEQMRYEYLTRFWDKFGEQGFKKLIQNGTSCLNANIDYMYSQTLPGCATIATGANPAQHGIIGDEWYDRIKNKVTAATAGEITATLSDAERDKNYTPAKLSVSTIGDELKLANRFSRVLSISMDPSSAVLLAGHNAEGAYWMDEQTGEWVTSSYYRSKPIPWITDFSLKRMTEIYMDEIWAPRLPFVNYTECLPDKNDYEIGIKDKTTFPYLLSQIADTYKKYKALKQTPFGNTYTLDFAIQTILGENLGKDNNPDLLMISFSPTESIGTKFGPRSMELEDTYIRLDEALAFFIQFVEKELGKQNVLFFLTSTSGTSENNKYLSDNKLPSGQFKQAKAEQMLLTYLNALYGSQEWISYFSKQTVYLNQDKIEDLRLSLSEIQNKSANFLVKLSGIAQVTTSNQIQTTSSSDATTRKIANNYNQKRSGDLFITLEPGWTEQTMTEASTHNTGYSCDTHIPLIWYGWNVNHTTITRPLSLADIAPTISAILDIQNPNAATGNAIWEIVKNK